MTSIVHRLTAVFVGCVLSLAIPVASAPASDAANCPPASVGGVSVGTISVAGVNSPIKRVSFVPGGQLDPPATNRAAGLSTLNAPLNANEGTTVLTWHARYGKGCMGTLNGLITKPIGATFTVQPKGETERRYRITQRLEVPKGRYKAAWFAPEGPHRLALFTCGDLRNGKFHSTIAIFAEPVPSL